MIFAPGAVTRRVPAPHVSSGRDQNFLAGGLVKIEVRNQKSIRSLRIANRRSQAEVS